MNNVRVADNGAAFLIITNGTITSAHRTLGDAWRHIEWMYAVASQRFTVGKSETPVKEWINGMHACGCLDGTNQAANG